MSDKIRVTVWNEGRHEKKNPAVQAVYPDGMHTVIAKFLSAQPDMKVRTATLAEPEHGRGERQAAALLEDGARRA